MNPRVWNRKLHRWGAIGVALPFLIVICSGLLLQLKKQIPWVQPHEQRGESAASSLTLPQVLAISATVPQAGISEWAHIVQTLRYINDYVIPAVGPVEPVSAYRNPSLNVCAGGAPESAHKHYSAVDLVPLQETTREQLMRRLCAAHARRGTAYDVGLGFYAFLRFHVDTTKYRRWGADSGQANCPAIVRPVQIASAQQPTVPSTTATAATAVPLTIPPAVQEAAPAPPTVAPSPAPVAVLVPVPMPAAPTPVDPLAPISVEPVLTDTSQR